MPEPQKYVVGRETEVAVYDVLAPYLPRSSSSPFMGQVGSETPKVCAIFTTYSRQQKWLCVFVQIDELNHHLRSAVLYRLRTDLLQCRYVPKDSGRFFKEFETRVSEHLMIKDVLERGGRRGGACLTRSEA